MPTLLLADDNVTTQRVIALTFADPAFQVVTVGSSQQARDLMAGMRPDIVLASTSLPRNSGYELSEYMLGVETLKDVPVLLLSGAFESVDEARLTTSGARGVIEKPLEPTAVINRVPELLGFKEAQPALPAGRLITAAAMTADKQAAQDADPPLVGRKAPAEASPRDPLAAVIEVDDDWFADDPKPRDRASHHDILADANTAMPRAAAPVDPIFEMDDDWFVEDEKARQSGLAQQRELAAEMGIYEAELPSAEPVPNAPALPVPAVSVHEAPAHQAQVHPAPEAPFAPLAPSSVADNFAALLAIETGDAPPPPAAAQSFVVQAAAPQITDAMLDQIAQRVADRLSSGTFGAELREAMTATLRDSVRTVVSETAERLVREEIARVKARIERDTP